MEIQSLGTEEALKMFYSSWWIGESSEKIVERQLFTKELICPFDVYSAALTDYFKTYIWTHIITREFIDDLRIEFCAKRGEK